MSNSVSIRKLENSEVNLFNELIQVFVRVFETENFDQPDQQYLQNLLNKEDFMVFVAIQNNEVIGGLTAYTLDQYYNSRKLAYLYDLAVQNQYQRKGIGKKLMNGINEYCAKNNYEEVFLQADAEDDHAIDFYRKTNTSVETEALQFGYILK